MIIIDTDVFSALVRSDTVDKVRAWLDGEPSGSVWTTSVTVLEVRFGLATMAVGRRRSTLKAEIDATLKDDLHGRIIPFDAAAAEETAMLMADRQKRGRRIELRDSMIAGIAIACRATLATRNTGHFADLPIPVVNPWLD